MSIIEYNDHERYLHDPLRTEWHDMPVGLTAKNFLVEDSFGITPLHYAFLNPTLPIPADLLNTDLLTKKLPSGQTLLHLAAATGKLNDLPEEFLTPENISIQDDNGRTPIHITVSLSSLPKCGLTEETLTIPDNEGNTPMHLCCSSEWANDPVFSQLPKTVITHRTMLAVNQRGESPLHLLAHGNAFQYLTKDFLTPELLLLSDNKGYTVCHHALDAAGYSYSGLEHFPNECLTPEVLLKKDNVGYPALYYAAKTDLHYLPTEFKTTKYFLSDRYDKETLFHVASHHATVFDLPVLLTAENLLENGSDGKTPLENILKASASTKHGRALLGIDSLFSQYSENFMGIDFPDSAKSIFCFSPEGEEWWEKNKGVIRSQKSLRQEEDQPESTELF